MKRILLFIGLKIVEIVGVILGVIIIFAFLWGIIWTLEHCRSLHNIIVFGGGGLIGIFIICGIFCILRDWFKANWKWAGKLLERK